MLCNGAGFDLTTVTEYETLRSHLNPGELIHEIRKARGETMVKFAAQLGLRQNTISQYESGKIVPSSSVLLGVFRLATTARHKASVRSLLGDAASVLDKEDAFEAAAADLRAKIDDAASALSGSDHARQRFATLATAVVSDPRGIPLWLCELMQLWLESQGDLKARQEFEAVVHDAAMRLRQLPRL